MLHSFRARICFDKDTSFVNLPLYTTRLDFKSDNHYMIEVQTFSFISKGLNILAGTILRVRTIFIQLKYSTVLQIIGQLADMQFHGQVRPVPLLFHGK